MADIVEYDEPARYWLQQIEGGQKDCENWYERGKGVLERYLDKKDAQGSSAAHKMNVLWSNVQTIQPALYAKTPNPKVQRRYRDKDPVGKWAAIVLERALGYTLDAYDVDYAVRGSVLDYLLPGRGQVWVSYEPTFTQGPPGPDGKPTEQIAWEYCKTEHLNWKDFLHSPARTWDEVWWVAKRAWLSKDEVKANDLLKAKADKLTFTEKKDDETSDGKGERIKKAAIWVIWSKPHGKVIYVSKNCPEILAETPPPIKFDGFFPCPRPLTTTCTTDSVIPTPDFCQYQNQADEIDRLSQRINMLTKALRVVGVYDGSQESLAKLLETVDDNQMVAVDNWTALATNGGLKGSVDFLPLAEVVKALEQCYISRDQAKAVMYEITGISDIVRGASDAQETATAQQIKSQWGSLRIRDRQAEVQRFVRDIMRLKSEIVAEHFQLETLKTMSNAPILMAQEKQALQQRKQMQEKAQQAVASGMIDPAQAQQLLQANPQLQQMMAPLTLDEEQRLREPVWEEVHALLKDQKLRSFRIDIETDSTIQADEVAEKQARIEFVTASTGFLQAWGPMVMQFPKLAPLFGATLTFASRAFKQSDALESEIEALVDTLTQQAIMQPNGPPQPEDPKVAANEQKAELDQKKHEDTHQLERERMAQDDAFRREQADKDRQAKLQSEQMNAQQEAQTRAVESQQQAGQADQMVKAIMQAIQKLQTEVGALTKAVAAQQ